MIDFSSPCLSICELDKVGNCLGCLRTKDEIFSVVVGFLGGACAICIIDEFVNAARKKISFKKISEDWFNNGKGSLGDIS